MKKFLKPSLRQLIFFLLLLTTFIIAIITITNLANILDLVPLNVYYVDVVTCIYLSSKIWGGILLLIFPFFIDAPEFSATSIIITFSLFGIPFCWIFSSLLAKIWEKIFGIFKERARLYEKIMALSILSLFILMGIILPIAGKFFIHVEKNTYINLPVFKEIKLRNDFFVKLYYKLPGSVMCYYNPITGCLQSNIPTYRTNIAPDSDSIYNRIVVLNRGEERKVYLGENELKKYGRYSLDSILLFNNVKVPPDYDKSREFSKNYCNSFTKEDIKKAEKINIPPPSRNSELILISPNGSEVWEVGKTYDIKWQSNGVDKVDIEFYRECNKVGETIVSGIAASSGKYSWTIPSFSVNPGEHKILIRARDTSSYYYDFYYNAFDRSDDYFSIISK